MRHPVQTFVQGAVLFYQQNRNRTNGAGTRRKERMNNYSVQMIMVNLFSEFLSSSHIDFVSVHYSRYDIVSAEFFFNEMERFFIKLLCVFAALILLLVSLA